jgi:glycosyltransferase involved in cell wall biosynthesis
VRVLIDYRSALRSRSGVGEYTHELVRALVAGFDRNSLDITIFSSSLKDRLSVTSDLGGVRAIDLRVPVSVLNFSWHRLEWPRAESLAGAAFDVTHSLHPLLLPARRAAQIVTIHDLSFLKHPERTVREVRRDYPALARQHAHRADHIIVNSHFTASEVTRRLDVPADRISVCSPGAPQWTPRGSVPGNAYVLFLGTLEPRKNLGTLLDAYERLLSGDRAVPDLVIAGSPTAEAQRWLDRISRPPLLGRVTHIGYIDPDKRQSLYAGARMLVQPSFEEGFGLTVLEAMTVGVPVVASDRGALPEVLGGAGQLVDPEDPNDISAAIDRLLEDAGLWETCRVRGIARAREYSWSATAGRVFAAYQAAINHRCASA